MNVGNKISELRTKKNMTVEDLAKELNVSTEEVIKYENNDIEPTLDKKILLCKILDTTLDEISVRIDRKPKPIDRYEEEKGKEEETEVEPEIIEEVPLATTTITYNEKIFDSMFKSDFKKYVVQSTISIVSYVLFAIFALLINAPIFYIFFFGLSVLNIIRLMMSQSKYKNNKNEWLEQFDNVKKEYYFYENFIDVTSSDTDSICTRFEYDALYRVIERDAVILCIFNTAPKAILTIVKSNLDEGTIDKIRTILQKNCKDYVVLDPIAYEDKVVAKKQNKMKTLLSVSIILCFVGYFCSNIIYNLFNLDDTLEVNLILYGVATLFPLFCIIVAVIGKKKLQLKTTKNFVIGIIVLVLCIFNMVSAYVSHIVYKAQNNDELVEIIENKTATNLPDYYYTIFTDNDLESVQNEEYQIIFDSYQVWTFSKKQEVEIFEKEIEKSSLWVKKDNYNQEQVIELTDNAKELLGLLMYETPDKADYYMLIENGDNYIFSAYYNSENTGYMLTVEYSKVAVGDETKNL